MARFDDSILEDILTRIDIVELISGYFPLKRAGRNFKACCPFHHEKTASFMVSADKQIFHCFGCGAGGNAFHFLMQHERMEFPEAVETLARKAGVTLPEKKHISAAGQESVTQIYRINELAARFYQDALFDEKATQPRMYLKKRGISPATAREFKLGFSTNDWDRFLLFAKSHGFTAAAVEKAGLALLRQEGGWYDRFRNRLMFPILDAKSQVLGFGARVLDASLPKYINSPETPVYVKGRHLFGLHCAKDAIRQKDRVVVVEGYLDCIIPFQHGLRTIVASLGTALTSQQVRLLKRYTRNIFLVYDGDNAGQMAALRSLDIFVEEEVQARIAVLPAQYDPDSYVREHGLSSFEALLDAAQSVFDFRLTALCRKFNSKDPEGKSRIASEMLPMLKKTKNSILVSEYIKQLSEKLSVSESRLYEELKKLGEAAPYAPEFGARKQAAAPVNPTEKLLVQLMLAETSLIEQIHRHLVPEDFSDQRTGKIVEIMYEMLAQGKAFEPNSLINYFAADDVQQLICESSFLPETSLDEKERVATDCVNRIKDARLKQRKQRLHDQIKEAQTEGDEKKLHLLMEEFHMLIKKG